MTKQSISLWGRSFDLPISHECYQGEAVSATQIEAEQTILKQWEVVESSEKALKEYILADGAAEIDEPSIGNIFRYVMPQSLFIANTPNVRTVALMCEYRFDPEHGIAIVFENEKLIEIGPQDIVL